MIIFNLYAILVVFLSPWEPLPILALQYFNLIDEHLSMVLVAWEALVVSALSQMAGRKRPPFFTSHVGVGPSAGASWLRMPFTIERVSWLS